MGVGVSGASSRHPLIPHLWGVLDALIFVIRNSLVAGGGGAQWGTAPVLEGVDVPPPPAPLP